MKKTILLPILLLGLTMASCGSNSKAGAKEQFKDMSYGEALLDDEAQQVKARAKAALKDVSSAEITTTSYQLSNNVKTEATTKAKMQVSSEGFLRAEATQEAKTTNQGLTFTEKHEMKMQEAVTSKDDVYYDLEYLSQDADEFLLVDALASKAEADLEAEQMAADMLVGYLAQLQATQVFKVKKGYEAVLTEIDEAHTAIDWDNGYKELIQIQKSEVKYVFNEKYQLTELRTVQETQTNRDPDTGAWHDKAIVINQTVQEGKAKYDAKASDAGLASELVAKGANSIIAATQFTAFYAKVDGETVTPVDTDIVQVAYEISSGVNTRKLGVVVDFEQNASYNAFALAVSAAVKDDVFAAQTTAVASPALAFANTEITAKQYEYMGVNLELSVFSANVLGVRALVELEVASAPASTALTVSNLQVTVY